MKTDRKKFLVNAGRISLAAILFLIAASLSRKTVTGRDCSGCPDFGKCNGESFCSPRKK
ncbi:MAG: hypothetical protein RBR81_02225 [Bacteroidales bacterium]|nr:hypothetical protein [Bacteroidales bacterium]